MDLYNFDIEMPTKLSWSKRPHFSIGGLEVVPDTGLEVALGCAPEVYSKHELERGKMRPASRLRNGLSKRKTVGWPTIWIATGIMTFVIGIALGGTVVSIITSGKTSSGDERYGGWLIFTHP